MSKTDIVTYKCDGCASHFHVRPYETRHSPGRGEEHLCEGCAHSLNTILDHKCVGLAGDMVDRVWRNGHRDGVEAVKDGRA